MQRFSLSFSKCYLHIILKKIQVHDEFSISEKFTSIQLVILKMSLKSTFVIDENNCYNEIIDCFKRSKSNLRQREICKDRSIIKLMQLWEKRKDIFYKEKELIKNSLIFVLSLFQNEDQPPDFYNSIGKDVKNLQNYEKETIISLLKAEFR